MFTSSKILRAVTDRDILVAAGIEYKNEGASSPSKTYHESYNSGVPSWIDHILPEQDRLNYEMLRAEGIGTCDAERLDYILNTQRSSLSESHIKSLLYLTQSYPTTTECNLIQVPIAEESSSKPGDSTTPEQSHHSEPVATYGYFSFLKKCFRRPQVQCSENAT